MSRGRVRPVNVSGSADGDAPSARRVRRHVVEESREPGPPQQPGGALVGSRVPQATPCSGGPRVDPEQGREPDPVHDRRRGEVDEDEAAPVAQDGDQLLAKIFLDDTTKIEGESV